MVAQFCPRRVEEGSSPVSPEAWIVALGIALAVLCYAAFELHRYVQRTDEAVERHKDRADAYFVAVEAMTAERDEALRQKASQFETWQSESTNLRADVAALERKCEAMKTDRDRFWSHLDATRDRLASAESDLRAAYAEIALLRPIADTAEKLLDDEKFPGEWAPVRAAIRARKEAKL